MVEPLDYEATALRNGKYAVHPKGQLGTCGWYPYPWTVIYVYAINPAHAIVTAWPLIQRQLPSG